MCDITEITGNTGVCCDGAICGTARDYLVAELRAAEEELVQATISLAWDIDPHATTPDTATITDAADNLNHKLEQS